MAQAFDICIRGAGIVGSTLALLLARERLRVALVAAPAAPHSDTSDVRAYALNAASRAMLESLRCWPADAHATPVLAMRVQGDDGGEVNFSAAQQGVAALAWIVDVQALQAQLAEALRYQPLVEPLAEPPQQAALTVVCEGKASRTRAELGVEFDVAPYHQRAIATRITAQIPHGQVARQWFAAGDILAFLPLGGPQGNSLAVVWSVDEAKAAELAALPAPEFALRLQHASQGALGHVELAAERAVWPLQLASAQRWVGSPALGNASTGAWALAGDAAHTVHPLAGQGLNLGLADAAELARVLRERDYWRNVADARLLRQYERARKAALAPMAGVTDGLQRLFERRETTAQNLRNWGMMGFERSGPLKAWVARQAMGL